MKLQEILKQKEEKVSQLIEEVGMFFAFSNKQLEEGMKKHPLAEGDKYLDLGAGMFILKSNKEKEIQGFKDIEEWFVKTIDEYNLRETYILYEIYNHECYYTYDITDAVEKLKGFCTEEDIQNVFNKHKKDNHD